MKHYIIIFFVFFSLCNQAFGQLNLILKLTKSLDTSKIKLFYIYGEVNKFLHPEFVNHTAVINEVIKSRYARLIVNYPDKLGRLPGLCLLVTKGISTLQFSEITDDEINPLANYKAKNVINVNNTSIYNAINKYTKSELKEYDKIIAENKSASTVSLYKLLNQTYETLAFKQFEFIKLHSTNYFYFEKFINEIVPPLKAKYLAELHEIFNTSFPASFKKSYEGKAVKLC